MKQLVALFFVVAMTIPASAFAQNETPREQRLDFEALELDGNRYDSIGYWRNVPKAHFDRLDNLKKSFMPKVKQSTNQKALN